MNNQTIDLTDLQKYFMMVSKMKSSRHQVDTHNKKHQDKIRSSQTQGTVAIVVCDKNEKQVCFEEQGIVVCDDTKTNFYNRYLWQFSNSSITLSHKRHEVTVELVTFAIDDEKRSSEIHFYNECVKNQDNLSLHLKATEPHICAPDVYDAELIFKCTNNEPQILLRWHIQGKQKNIFIDTLYS